MDTARAVDDAGGGKIRTGDQFHQARDVDIRAINEGQTAVDHLVEIMGRHIGGQAHGDASRTVDEQIGNLGGKDAGFMLRLVVVGDEVDGLFIQVRQQFVGDARHAHLGVTHRRRRITVHRTEVALPVHQHVAQRERLGHAHNGVINRGITMGMVLTHDVTHDTGRLLVGLVPVVTALVHTEQHAAVHRLEAVADIGQGPAHDDAHGVLHVGGPHLVFDVDGQDFFGEFGHGGAVPFRWLCLYGH